MSHFGTFSLQTITVTFCNYLRGKRDKDGNNYEMLFLENEFLFEAYLFFLLCSSLLLPPYTSLLQLFFFFTLLPCAWTWLVGSMFSCYCSRCFYGEWFNFTRFVAFSCCACIMALMQIVERESLKPGGVN